MGREVVVLAVQQGNSFEIMRPNTGISLFNMQVSFLCTATGWSCSRPQIFTPQGWHAICCCLMLLVALGARQHLAARALHTSASEILHIPCLHLQGLCAARALIKCPVATG